jgi:hypothetical protein
MSVKENFVVKILVKLRQVRTLDAARLRRKSAVDLSRESFAPCKRVHIKPGDDKPRRVNVRVIFISTGPSDRGFQTRATN